MIARNKLTGKLRIVKDPSCGTIEKAISNGVDKCSGPCRCTVEPDGECSKGWPSRLIAMGLC